MKQILFVLFIFLWGTKLNAQNIKFRDHINKDSLFEASLYKIPQDQRNKYLEIYKNGTIEEKEFLLLMISLPQSSKKELIENYETHKAEILKLKAEFTKMVPKKHIVYIEFEAASDILTVPDQITIKIFKIGKKIAPVDSNDVEPNHQLKEVSQNWNLTHDSKELKKIMKYLGWTQQSLSKIKQLLDSAKCISIENKNITTIGFARSKMGIYSYKLFDKPLSENQKLEYNNGCQYIYYNNTVVLEYCGGAFGPQCFEKDF